ncbi:hypothetical protein SARC_15058, partial [Sphaeroforma arctica JP610]
MLIRVYTSSRSLYKKDDDDEDEDGDEDMAMDDAADETPVVDSSVSHFGVHEDAVYCVAVSPVDSNISASGGGDDKAYLWRTENGTVLHELIGHTDSVTAIEFSA